MIDNHFTALLSLSRSYSLCITQIVRMGRPCGICSSLKSAICLGSNSIGYKTLKNISVTILCQCS